MKSRGESGARLISLRYQVFLFFCLLLLQSSQSVSATSFLTIQQAIEKALSQHPNIRAAREQVEQAKADSKVARSTFFPTLSFSSGIFTRKDAANHPLALFGGSAYNTYNSSILIDQPVWVFGSGSGVSVARKGIELSRLRAETQARDLTIAVVQAYYDLVTKVRAVDTLERQKKISEESLQTAKRRESNGLGKRLDVLQVRTELALLEGELLAARDDVQAAAAQLAKQLGTPEVTQLDIKNELRAPPLSEVDSSVDLRSPFIPELMLMTLELEQANEKKWAELGKHLPSLSATGQYMWNSFTRNDLFSGQTNAWVLGMSLNVPIFSGLSSLYEQRSLSSQVQQLEARRESLRNDIASRQIIARKNIEAGYSTISTGEEAQKLATSTYEEARRMYRVGLIDYTKLHESEQAFVRAEQQLNQAKLTYIKKLAEYFLASGQNMSILVNLLEKANL